MNQEYIDYPAQEQPPRKKSSPNDRAWQFFVFRIIFVFLLAVSIMVIKLIPGELYSELRDWYNTYFIADVDPDRYLEE